MSENVLNYPTEGEYGISARELRSENSLFVSYSQFLSTACCILFSNILLSTLYGSERKVSLYLFSLRNRSDHPFWLEVGPRSIPVIHSAGSCSLFLSDYTVSV